MADTYGPEVRSRVMRQVKSQNTKPELALRRALWAEGVRGWRCHRKDLPGKPDLAFGVRRVAVFVDGAFWHGHPSKYWPGRTSEYWDQKIARNQARDRAADLALADLGWAVVRIWDFEVNQDARREARRVADVLRGRVTDHEVHGRS